MKIKRLSLRNFRQFKDMSIDFSNDSQKNITVILAENSTGKTTLMQSIKWCLYGDSETNLDNLNELINFSALDDSLKEKEELWVETVLNNDGTEYILRRTKEIHVNSGRKASELIKMIYKNNEGETIILEGDPDSSTAVVKKIKRMINNILSKEMASYFLFDGERIDSLGRNDSKSRQDIKQAINAINDFTIINNAITSLQRLDRQYNAEVSEKSNDEELKSTISAIEEFEFNIEKLIEEIERKKGINHKLNEKIAILDEKLNKYNDIESYVQKRTEIERELISDRKELSQNKKLLEHYYLYRRDSLIFLLEEKYKNIEFNKDFEEKTVPAMEVQAIEHVISRGFCICGEKLTEKHLSILESQKNHQPPISSTDLINRFNKIITNNITGIDLRAEILEEETAKYKKLEHDILSKEEELSSLSDEIDKSNLDDIKDKNTKRKELKDLFADNKKDISIMEYQLTENQKQIKQKKIEYQNKLEENKKYQIDAVRLDLINGALNFLVRRNKKYRQDKKIEIEEVANKHFRDIIYKNKEIKINNNFEYKVLEENKKPASPSEGERIAISMSLVLAIIEVHKNKSNQPEELQEIRSSADEFCLVLDAAFAKLDDQFSSKISEKLPKSVEQIILFSTERQFEGSVENSMNKYIGKKYKLEISNSNDENALTNNNLKLLEDEVKWG